VQPDTTNDRPQTPAQWAVRWHGLVAAAVLAASVPLFHFGWHLVLGHTEPPVRTRGQIAPPEATWATLQNGEWMLAEQRHLREASPVAWWLRGQWNETLFRLSVPQSAAVQIGSDGWLFSRPTVFPDARTFAARSVRRAAVFSELRDLVRTAGAELMVVIVPDKARVYPEFTNAPDAIARKAPLYGQVLQELRDAGIATVDLAAAMAAAKAAAPQDLLYYQRDTHWRPLGALAAARAIATAIEQGPLGARLGPREPFELGALTQVPALSDLVAVLGLLTTELPNSRGTTTTTPLSLLSAELQELRDYYAVQRRTQAGSEVLDGKDPAAEVLLIGTSFAVENGTQALTLALGRPVRAITAFGASGLPALQLARPEVVRGMRAKVVIWEIVERGLLEEDWR